MTLDPTNRDHWNDPKENIAPKNTGEKDVALDSTYSPDDILISMFDGIENTKPKERDFLISRAMAMKSKLPEPVHEDIVTPVVEVSPRPTTGPIPLFEELTTANERPLERIPSEELILKAEKLFKLLISTLEARAKVNKKIVGSRGVEYPAQLIAAQILNYFSGKPARITNAYQIKEKVLEVATISKELSQRDILEKGIQRKKEIWTQMRLQQHVPKKKKKRGKILRQK